MEATQTTQTTQTTEVVEAKTGKGGKGNFFYMSLNVVKEIAKQTNSAEAVIAYLALSQRKQDETIASTGGVPCIAKALGGIGIHRAKKLLAAVSKVSWGGCPTERAIVAPKVWTEITEKEMPEWIRGYPTKVLPPCGEDYFYLANSFMDGSNSGRSIAPITKIMQLPKHQRLDTLMLLIELYFNHQVSDFGGVDPNVLCTVWEMNNQIDLKSYGKAYDDRYNRFFATVKRNKNLIFSDYIRSEMFEGDRARLETAFSNIQDLNVLYEVAVVFTDNPLEAIDAEVLYTLRVFDNYLETKEYKANSGLGGLATDATIAVNENGLYGELLGTRTAYVFGGKADLHVYAAPTESAQVVSVFRLKHQASTVVNGVAYLTEKRRTALWKNVFESTYSHTAHKPTEYLIETTAV